MTDTTIFTPDTRAAAPAARSAAMQSSARSAGTLARRPPAVCGSNSRR